MLNATVLERPEDFSSNPSIWCPGSSYVQASDPVDIKYQSGLQHIKIYLEKIDNTEFVVFYQRKSIAHAIDHTITVSTQVELLGPFCKLN